MSDIERRKAQRTRAPTYPLRLPNSLRRAVDRLAERDQTSVNQFIAMAVAEKIAALSTADEFERRTERADFDAFDRLMNRQTATPEIEADRLDPDRP